jgi:hypothetical protein
VLTIASRVVVLVVVAIVIVSVAILVAVMVLVLRLLSRHLSRTRDQPSTIFTVQMALQALVQEALHQSSNGNGVGAMRPASVLKARETAVNQLALLQDVQLKELTNALLQRTEEVRTAKTPGEAARLRTEVTTLQETFARRSTEVVRSINLTRHL